MTSKAIHRYRFPESAVIDIHAIDDVTAEDVRSRLATLLAATNVSYAMKECMFALVTFPF